MSAIITRSYEGHSITYNSEGWFNATEAAAKFDRRVDKWIKTKETQTYIDALCEMSNTPKKGYLKTLRGTNGGTWLHPKLAVMFSRWLDPRFAIWCDIQIDHIIRGKDDWRKLRHASASTNKVANDILKMVRQEHGKGTAPHHYANEARMVNHALTGQFKGLDRDTLNGEELALLAFLEERNTVLIGRGLPYAERKTMLGQYAKDWKLGQLAINGEAAA